MRQNLYDRHSDSFTESAPSAAPPRLSLRTLAIADLQEKRKPRAHGTFSSLQDKLLYKILQVCSAVSEGLFPWNGVHGLSGQGPISRTDLIRLYRLRAR